MSGCDAAELAPWLAEAEARLAQAGCAHVLIGGAVVQLYGLRARTRDVDFLVKASPDEFDRLPERLSDPVLRIQRKAPWHLRMWRGEQYADLILAEMEVQQGIVDAAQHRTVAGRSMPVARPEDMIVLKMLAGRPQDRRDVAEIQEHIPNLDHATIAQKLAEFGIAWPCD